MAGVVLIAVGYPAWALAIILFCMFPQYFPRIAYIYAGLCYASAVGRIVLACKTLKR